MPAKSSTPEKEICRETEAIQRRTDRGSVKAGRSRVPLAELIRRVGISEQTLYLSVEEAVRWIGGRPGSSGPTHCVFSVHELARRYNTTPVRHRREIGLAFSGSQPFRVLRGLCFAFSLERQVALMTRTMNGRAE